MASIPKGIDTINEATNKGAVIRKLSITHGAKNVQLVSGRSLRFDLPDGKAKDGINRVKITAREDGTVDIRLMQVTELDLIGGVEPANVAKTLAAFLGLEV